MFIDDFFFSFQIKRDGSIGLLGGRSAWLRSGIKPEGPYIFSACILGGRFGLHLSKLERRSFIFNRVASLQYFYVKFTLNIPFKVPL